MPQELRPALQKDSNISFCSICCVLSFWNLGNLGGGTDGETISSAEAWVKEHLPLRAATFLGHFLNRSCQSLLYLQGATRALSKHTSSLCAKVCKKGRPQPSWITHQTSPAMHCFPHSSPLFQETKAASVYPHPHHTVRKPWASVSTSKAVLAAALEMEPDNFGYEWLVCSSGWNYGWRRCSAGSLASEVIGVQQGQRAGKKGKKGFLAVLCPCGETTAKRSHASNFWVSPQMPFEKVPAAANCDGGFCAVSTSNWNQGNLWHFVL